MPYKDGSLTKGELAFSEAFAQHGDREKAEIAAGVGPGYGYRILLRPEVQAEIRQREQARLVSEGLPAAVGALIEIVKSSKAPAAARVQAAKVMLDRTLGAQGEGNGKDIHELTPDELAKEINKLEAMAASMAKPVNALNNEVFD